MSSISAEPDLYKSALDVIPLEAAVLDASGRIVAVNQAWRASGRKGVAGQAYADVCGAELSPGLLSVLDGRRESFPLSYVSAGGRGVRWFEAQVRRFEAGGQPAVLVTHEDVTASRQAELAIRDSEARYRGVVEDQDEMICRFRPDTTLTFVNEAYCRHFGRDRGDLIGRSFLELVPEDMWDEIRTKLSLLNPDKPTQGYAHPVKLPDGGAGWQYWTDRAFFDEAGNVAEYQSVGRDVTALKATEEALRESEDRFELLADNLTSIFWVMDWQERRATYVSPAFKKIFGYEPTELYRKPDLWAMCIHPEDRDAVYEVFTHADERRFDEVYRIRRSDGQVRFLRDQGFPIRDADGVVRQLVGIAEDVTDTIVAEERSRVSEERFRELAENVAEVFWVFDWDKRVIEYVSPAFSRVFGHTEAEILADPAVWINSVHPEDRERVNAQFRRAHEGLYEDRYRVVHRDGRVRWLRDRGRPTLDEAGRVVRIVGIAEDITEQVESELKVRQSEERYRAAAEGSLDAFYLLEAARDGRGVIEDFVFRDANERGARLVSRAKSQIIDQRLCELLPVNREQGFFEKYARVVETRQPLMEEFQINTTDIEASWLQHQVVPVGDGVAITTRDVTERKTAERKIERQYEETQLILDSVPAFIWYKDRRNNILRVNRTVAESLGLPPEQVEGQPSAKFYPQLADKYFQDDLEVIRSGEPKLGYVEPLEVPGAGRRWVQTDKVPVRDERGEVIGIIVIASDVTERREADLHSAVLDKAEDERRLMGQELHDGVAQQLTGLRMLVESLRRRVRRGQPVEAVTVDDLARVVAEAGTEVRRLISGLTPEPITADELPVSLRHLAGNIETLFGVTVRADVPDLSSPLGDELANHLLRIAQEAAHNAAKHAGATRVSISIEESDAALTLIVRDDGRGLSEGPAPTTGGGRGLRIMRYRAEMIGGTFDISSPAGAGTVVCCKIPLENPS